MKWDGLMVVAARATSEMGMAISNPLVRMCERMYFIPGDVNEDDPEPNIVIHELEMHEMIEGGLWLGIPSRPAEKGKVVVVMSNRLAELAFAAGLPLDEFKTPSEFRRWAYLSCDEAKRWRESFADRLIDWADEQVRRHFAPKGEDQLTMNSLEEPYRHALFLCHGDKERLTRVYTALIAISARRLKVVVDLASQVLEMSPSQLSILAGSRAQSLIPD